MTLFVLCFLVNFWSTLKKKKERIAIGVFDVTKHNPFKKGTILSDSSFLLQYVISVWSRPGANQHLSKSRILKRLTE